MIAVDRVSCVRGGRPLLEDVSLTLRPGSITAILGPNGAGKSTLIRLVSGEWHPDSGGIRWNNNALSDIPRMQLARQRAVVSQQIPSLFSFRVYDVVAMGRVPHAGLHPRKEQDIIADAMEATGVHALADRSINTLSGGERQRAHWARALAQLHEARLAGAGALLLDEPTAHLDVAQQQNVLALIRNLARDGLALLVVLHDINHAACCADQVILLRNGRVQKAGATANTLSTALLRDVFNADFEKIYTSSGQGRFMPCYDASTHHQ